MLHIILLILKILGIILAVIIGILLLAICAVLFIPVCYRAEAASSGTVDDLEARGKVSWMFGLIKIVAEVKNKKADAYVKIAWKKLGGKDPAKPDIRRKMQEQRAENTGSTDHVERIETEQTESVREKDNKPSDHQEDIYHEKEVPTHQEEAPVPEKHTEHQKAFKKASRISEKSKQKHKKTRPSLAAKFRTYFEKIKCTIQGFCAKIKEISEKKDRAEAFLKEQHHTNAFGVAKKHLVRFLKRVIPDKFHGNVRFGFEDPYHTGQVLAVLGILYPFIGENMEVTPDFQEQVLEGDLRIKGRIYVIHLVILAVHLILCRDVRQTVKDIREFKG